jgi:hypothetical protein
VTDALNPLSPARYYVLQGRGGDLIIVSMERVDGVIDPLVMIIDSRLQNVLAVDNDGGSDRNARLRFVLPADGAYIIKATSAQQGDLNGSYRLFITLANPTATPAPPQTATAAESQFAPLRAGITNGTITRAVSFRAYAFHLKAGDNFRVVPSTSGGLQVGLYLFNPAMREAARAELGAPLAFVASRDAGYLLIVSRIDGIGTFALDAVLPDREPVPLGAERLIPGQRQEGAIGAQPGALYAFDAPPGTRLNLSLTGSDLIAVLAGPAFDEIAVSSTGAIRDVLLRTGGTYMILVMPQGGVNAFQPAAYALTFQGQIDPNQVPTVTPTVAPTLTPVVSASATPGAEAGFPQIRYGSSVDGRLEVATPRVYYRFQGFSGDQITLTMAAGADSRIQPLLYLYYYGQAPPLLITGAVSNAAQPPRSATTDAVLPYTGVYVIVATSKDAASGTFTLGVTRRG